MSIYLPQLIFTIMDPRIMDLTIMIGWLSSDYTTTSWVAESHKWTSKITNIMNLPYWY